ncbi:MAG TPA: HAD-IIIA family hydrolase [Gemmatimonadaceae bacterium]|nr:HAD-IIIA family hydrolase [Gemmatimonadaceae bacterium]
MTGTGRRAAFLDRDGTLIEDAHYLADADAVRLLPGAAAAVRELNAAGVLAIVITNQSGIALGRITPRQYEGTRERLDHLLLETGARLDGTYHCPHHPAVTGPCTCRKPGVALHRRAASDLGIDLTRSLFVGDRQRDVAPGRELGGFARLVPSRDTPPDEVAQAVRDGAVADTLAQAVRQYLRAFPE